MTGCTLITIGRLGKFEILDCWVEQPATKRFANVSGGPDIAVKVIELQPKDSLRFVIRYKKNDSSTIDEIYLYPSQDLVAPHPEVPSFVQHEYGLQSNTSTIVCDHSLTISRIRLLDSNELNSVEVSFREDPLYFDFPEFISVHFKAVK